MLPNDGVVSRLMLHATSEAVSGSPFEKTRPLRRREHERLVMVRELPGSRLVGNHDVLRVHLEELSVDCIQVRRVSGVLGISRRIQARPLRGDDLDLQCAAGRLCRVGGC